MKKNSYSHLTELACKFQDGQITKRAFLKDISDIILSIPRIHKVYNRDVIYDFYAEVISIIDKTMSRYKKHNNASFYTWFSFILLRQYKSFSQKRKKKIDFYNEPELKKYYYHTELPLNSPDLSFLNNLDISCLTPSEKKIIAYKYGFDIDNHDISATKQKIDDKIKFKKILESRASVQYLKLLRIHAKLTNETNPTLKKTMLLKEEKILGIKRNIEFQLKTYKLVPSNKWVGRKTGLSSGTVSSYIMRIKEKLGITLALQNLKRNKGYL